MGMFDSLSPPTAHSLKWLHANIESGKIEIEMQRGPMSVEAFGMAPLKQEGMISWGLYSVREIEHWIAWAQSQIDDFWNMMERA